MTGPNVVTDFLNLEIPEVVPMVKRMVGEFVTVRVSNAQLIGVRRVFQIFSDHE